MSTIRLWVTAVALATASAQTAAHHSNAPHYDANRPVQIEGTITQFEFVNPHAFVHLSVEGDNATTVVWDCETAAAIMLQRRGWSADTLVPGQRVTVNGIAARRDPHGCSIRSIVLDDGSELTPQGGAVAEAAVPSSTAGPGETALSGIVGNWVRDTRRRPNGPATGPGPADRGPPGRDRFTAEGFAAQAGYDQRFDDPSFRCSASSIARAWSGPGTPTEISLIGDRITIRHEFMDTVRNIQFGAREHPENLTPVEFGHSIAWLEGETLIIDTIGYAAGVLFPHPGVLHSDALHTVERLSVDPTEDALHVAWTAEDPKYFATPFSGEFIYRRSSFDVQPFDCTVENANR